MMCYFFLRHGVHKFPKASSLDVAKTIVDHFEVTKNQAAATVVVVPVRNPWNKAS